jgi:hypothetical protein
MNIEEVQPSTGGITMQPVGRHQSVAYKNKIFVIGGYDGISKFNTLSVFDLETKQWSRPTPKGDIPEPRSNHSCALIGHTVYSSISSLTLTHSLSYSLSLSLSFSHSHSHFHSLSHSFILIIHFISRFLLQTQQNNKQRVNSTFVL